MAPIFMVLFLILVFFILGFGVPALWWVAFAFLVIWILGFAAGPRGGNRWWYW